LSELSEEREKLEDLLRRQQVRRVEKKRAKRALRRARNALNKLKGKIAATKQRISLLKVTPAQKAVNWAMRQQGVAEKPDGSNWGVPVQDWIKFTGYGSPVPWCGCFVARAVVGAGGAKVPTRIRLGYNGYIVADAEDDRNGLREVAISEARPGDIVTFDFPHIALVRGRPSNGYLPTIEGNTSPLSSGSQANGGTVAAKSRPLSQVRVIARPTYP
jgi:hypothetical protein